jgi:long-chain acyl-CoA synthetase
VSAQASPWTAKYPEFVPRDLSIPSISLPELLTRSVARWPDRVAIIYYGRKWTYRELGEATDRVALYLPNCPAYPIAFFGALRAGLTVVQISPLYLGQDLQRILSDARPRAIVLLEIHYPQLAAVSRELLPPLRFVARLREFYPFPQRLFVNMVLRRRSISTRFPRDPEVRPWGDLLAPGCPPAVTIDPARDVAVLQYTGGTTGRAKAAMLTHTNLVANALQCQAWFSLQPPGTGVVLASIPFFHVYGMTVALTFPIAEGATIILQTRPDVPEILRLVRKYRPTEFPGVPALYQGINNHPEVGQYDLHSIRICVSGSAPLPVEVARRFRALTGAHLIEGYGLTEASPVTHANPVTGDVRDGSIGVPLPLTDQMIVDLETGTRVLPTGAVGELCVRGPQVMLGYYQQPGETELVLRDGWLHTGDVARLDPEGYAYIVDRKKDMIDVGGLKVYPREVEEVLYQHPAVQEASVAGVADPTLGEVVAAFVVRRPGAELTAEELVAFVKARIAHYKAPRRVVFRDSLPRSAIQKVLRRVLREELEHGGAAGGSAPASAPPGVRPELPVRGAK